MLAVAVCDEAHRLLGAVTVDDVLDRQLGTGWRQRGVTSRARTRLMVKRREDLTSPRSAGRRIEVPYDSDAFGRFSEAVARYFGTARFLAIQTVIVIVWIFLNVAVVAMQWDPYPFILLNLVFSTAGRVRRPADPARRRTARSSATGVQAELDRHVAERTQSDTEFLAREIAGVRLILSDAVTGEELREQLADVKSTLDAITRRLDEVGRPVRRRRVGDDDIAAVEAR